MPLPLSCRPELGRDVWGSISHHTPWGGQSKTPHRSRSHCCSWIPRTTWLFFLFPFLPLSNPCYPSNTGDLKENQFPSKSCSQPFNHLSVALQIKTGSLSFASGPLSPLAHLIRLHWLPVLDPPLFPPNLMPISSYIFPKSFQAFLTLPPECECLYFKQASPDHP